MKRCLFPLILALLLLSGCAEDEIPETTESTTEPTIVETTAPGTYEHDSEMEQLTDAAVKSYSLEGNNFTWVKPMGGNLLLGAEGDNTELTVLSGTRRYVSAKGEVDLPENDAYWQITTMGLAYYAEDQRSVIYLDSSLRQIHTVLLPESASGYPLIDASNNTILYSAGSEIRGLDPDTGISRLIRQFSAEKAELLGLYFDGKVIACRLHDEAGKESDLYLSSETGKSISTDQNILSLETYRNTYFALRQDGVVLQQIFGVREDDVTANDLHVEGQLVPVMPLGGVVSPELTEDGLYLTFYSLADGKKVYAITLPDVTTFTNASADSSGVWLLAGTESQQKLYHWDVTKTPVEDDTVYSGSVYTAEYPDEAGLAQCQSRVDTLNKKHGLDIRIWENAIKEPGDYTLVPEYQTEAINKCLDELESALNLFPENFLYKSVNKRIRICIVRSVSDEVKAVQYWVKDDAFIVLSAGVDVYEWFMKGIGYVISTNVMGNSPILDSWALLNPEGFTYGSVDAFDNFLSGESMAFADKESMTSITEDRSRLFWYAIKPDNAQMFQSETMQAKLVLLCKGIRDAWRLERKTDIYPWEQHLNESIAYKKK